jgi:hypothetical protein
VHVPKNISRDRVQAHGARFLEAISPVFARDALVVQFAGDDLQRLAVESEVVAFDGDVMEQGSVLSTRD